MKSFRERNPVIIGAVALVADRRNHRRRAELPTPAVLFGRHTYSAYFEEVGELQTGAPVQVSGFRAGRVRSISLTPQGVLVTFTVADNIRLGERTEAAIRSTSLLGMKILEVSPRGPGHLSDVIPVVPDNLAVSAARCHRRSDRDDQRAQHRPAVHRTANAVDHAARHTTRTQDGRRRRGTVLSDHRCA